MQKFKQEIEPLKDVISVFDGGKEVPHGKQHNETATKKTVSLYLNRQLVEEARNHNLNSLRITENALNNILNDIQNRNHHFSLSEGSLSPKRERSRCGRRKLKINRTVFNSFMEEYPILFKKAEECLRRG